MSIKLLIIVVIIAVAVVGVAGLFVYVNLVKTQEHAACTLEAKLCPDGSSVGRVGPNCEFAACPENPGIVYKNKDYGFELTLASSWLGYTVEEQMWQGRTVDAGELDYSGPKIVIKNPKTTASEKWQDIPIMVFTPDVWTLVMQEKIAVSAAPIGPAKIGENSKYIFATPPRWYGFTDDKGWEEAVEIVKTFKAF